MNEKFEFKENKAKILRKPLNFGTNGEVVQPVISVSPILTDSEIDRAARLIMKASPANQLMYLKMIKQKISDLMAQNPTIKPTPKEAEALNRLDQKIAQLERGFF